MEKFSLTDIKKINYSDVYHYIYNNEKTSKQSIASALRMSLPTVTQHLNDLMEQGLIEKCGHLQSQIGRKATAYRIVPEARLAIGVEILSNQSFITVLNLYGHVIDRTTITLHFQQNESYFKELCEFINEFISAQPVNEDQILGIGIAMQGLVSQDGTEMIYGKILDCTGLQVDSFQKYFHLPCRFIHDAECAAVSELWDNEKISDAIYLSIGHHLGGSIILNRMIHNGRTGRSGTFEHTVLIPNGRPCYCGQKGCADCYCSIDGLLHKGENLENFFAEKETRNPSILNRWHSFLNDLAAFLNNIHMSLDTIIILGGHLAPFLQQSDLEYLHQEIRRMTAFPEDEDFIFRGDYQENAVCRGAGLPYIQMFLEQV